MTLRVFIMVPLQDGYITADTFNSLWTFARTTTVHLDKLRMQNMDLSRVRARAVKDFLESDCDYLWFVDSDVSFDIEVPERLFASGYDFCFSPYPKKKVNWDTLKVTMHDSGVPLQYGDPRRLHDWTFVGRKDDPEPGTNGFVPVKYCPMGNTVMSRKMLLDLSQHVRTFTDFDNRQLADLFDLRYERLDGDEERYAKLPEDYSFCSLAAEHGYHPMMLIHPPSAHTGTIRINVQDLPRLP
jgi:hypothetical protein